MISHITGMIYSFNVFVLLYFLTVNGIYILLTILSFFAIRRYMREHILARSVPRTFQSSFYKPISILAPAYNEQNTIVDNVRSLLQIRYPEFEIIVINDGSRDSTLDVLKQEYHLAPSHRPFEIAVPCETIRGVYRSEIHPYLVVVDKENGGKADALNAGINISRYPLVSSIDADSLLEHDVMLTLARPFLDTPDTVAAGGIVRIANGCEIRGGEVVKIGLSRRWLPNFQIVEYLRSFLFGRVGWDMLNGLVIISGAFGVFRKDTVVHCGGYRRDTVGEDMELVVRIHRTLRDEKKPYRVTFIPEPVCWTEAPESLKILGRQRNRWQRGLIETILFHRGMLFRPRYGIVGILVLPFFLFFEMLGPVVELAGYIVFAFSWAFGVINLSFALLFLSAAVLLGIVLSLAALVLEELSFRKYPRIRHILMLFLFGVLENFGYRQIHSFWRVQGIWSFLRGEKKWGAMERVGHRKTGPSKTS